MKERVIICGTSLDTRTLIDWTKDADYWVFNEVAGLYERGEPIQLVPDGPKLPYWCKRVDLSLQMHNPLFWRQRINLNDHRHYEWLQNHRGFPIYMQEVYPDVPASVKYPKQEIIDKFLSKLHRDNGEQIELFTSSPSYAIALALYMGYKVIEMYGVEMSIDTEYFRQASGVSFWLGIASGLGVEVILPKESHFMRDKLYGYTGEIMIMRDEFEVVMIAQEKELEIKKMEMFEAVGAETATWNALSMTKSKSDADRLYKEYLALRQKTLDLAAAYGAIVGKYTENKRYVAECDEKIRAAGGEKAVKVFLESGGVSPA